MIDIKMNFGIKMGRKSNSYWRDLQKKKKSIPLRAKRQVDRIFLAAAREALREGSNPWKYKEEHALTGMTYGTFGFLINKQKKLIQDNGLKLASLKYQRSLGFGSLRHLKGKDGSRIKAEHSQKRGYQWGKTADNFLTIGTVKRTHYSFQYNLDLPHAIWVDSHFRLDVLSSMQQAFYEQARLGSVILAKQLTKWYASFLDDKLLEVPDTFFNAEGKK